MKPNGNIYHLTLGNGQNIINLNFENRFLKEKEKGSISGYVRGNTNASMAGWKVRLEKHTIQSCKENKKHGESRDNQKNREDREDKEYRECRNHENREDKDSNREIFAITDNKGYYKFANLNPGTYSISIVSQKNWTIIKPRNNVYKLTLSSGQNIINLNFENTFFKGKGK